MKLLDNIELLMINNKMNRSELARAIGVAPSTINAWFTKDHRGITLKNLSKLADYFNISISSLVYGDKHELTFSLENYSEAELRAIRDFSNYLIQSRKKCS